MAIMYFIYLMPPLPSSEDLKPRAGPHTGFLKVWGYFYFSKNVAPEVLDQGGYFEPSRPIPPVMGSSSSEGRMEKLFKIPRMSEKILMGLADL